MLELFKSYSTILSLFRLDNITGQKLGVVLKLMKVELPNEVLSIIAELLNEAASSGTAKTFKDILDNEDLMTQVLSLISKVETNAQLDAVEPEMVLDVNSVISCPHCLGVFALRDAPGVKKQLDSNLYLENNSIISIDAN